MSVPPVIVAPLPLPASYRYGFVMCSVVKITADSVDDEDRFPEGRAGVGKIVFKPVAPTRKVVEDRAFALHQDAVFEINGQGQMVDAQGLPGAWLVTGEYEVEFKVSGGTIAPFLVSVTASHTFDHPLWLTAEAPYDPPPHVSVTTLVVPSGGGDAETLGRGPDGGLMWVPGGAAAVAAAAEARGARDAAAAFAALSWKGTQAEYDALPVKSPDTLYFITSP